MGHETRSEEPPKVGGPLYHDVRGLEIAVYHAFRMCMLHGLADRNKQVQPLARGQLLLIAVVDDRDSFTRPKMMPAIRAK